MLPGQASKLVGHPVLLSSPQQLCSVLFEELRLPPPKNGLSASTAAQSVLSLPSLSSACCSYQGKCDAKFVTRVRSARAIALVRVLTADTSKSKCR